MDKRIEKTVSALYTALKEALLAKPESRLSVEDILARAHVSRSTFYAHFKTVDELVRSVSEHIFEHVFSHSLKSEKTHDFSHTSIFDTDDLIAHIFYHLRDEKDLIAAIAHSYYSGLFFERVHAEIAPVTLTLARSSQKEDIPLSLRERVSGEIFVATLKYWIEDGFTESPEKLTSYYFSLVK